MPPAEEGQPPGTEVEVLPHTGEIIDLHDAVAVAKAYRSIQDLEVKLRSAKATLRDALVMQKRILGTGTFHLEGLGKVEVRGGTETVYDAQAIKRELLEAGMPRERVAEIVVETVDYKVDGRKAKQAASANVEYASIIERNRQVSDKAPSVSVP